MDSKAFDNMIESWEAFELSLFILVQIVLLHFHTQMMNFMLAY